MKQYIICLLFALSLTGVSSTFANSTNKELGKLTQQSAASLNKTQKELIKELNQLQAEQTHTVDEINKANAKISTLNIRLEKLEDRYEHLA